MFRHTLIAAALATTAWAAQAQNATYAIDPTHTFVTFEVPHLGISTNRGRFDKKTGTVQLDKTGRAGRVDITIETASISTGTAAFDQHLRGKDFFNSADFPTARFVADNFRFDGDKVAEVRGNLTLLGKTLPVQLKATSFACTMHPMLKVEVCGGDFETTIQRSQWGMSWGLNFGISDNVRLVVQVEGLKQP